MTDHINGLRIEPISKIHNRKNFCCGKPPLDEYLHRYARQNDEKNIAKSFVAIDEENNVVGYYSLCTASIEFEELPEAIRNQLPNYPVPAVLIARLAVDENVHGQGLGAKLLINALQRILTASAEIAIKAVLVDAIDDEAIKFYRHFEFIELPDQDLKLFLPIETIQQLF